MISATAARAAIVNFSATIDGAQETPPTFTGAMGSGTFVMDTATNSMTINIVITVPPPSGEIAAHIHGFAGPGVPAGILFGLPLGSPKNAVWNFMEAQEANIIAGLTYVNIHSNAFPGGEIRGQVLRVPSCGDGILDGGETCDDGNTANGDCCSSTCQLDAASTPCGSLCNTGTCDGAGTCNSAIRSNCRDALKTGLLIKNDSDDAKDKLGWKWIKGEATTLAEFGNPAGTTSYALCIYSGTTAIVDATIGPGAFWTAKPKGFKYKDTGGSSDGITKALLKEGAADKAKALVKGKGINLPFGASGDLDFPVTVQLVNDANNVCFEAVYTSAIKNEDEQFKAKTP